MIDVKPQADCDLLCSLGRNVKNFWDDLLKGGGKAGALGDSLKGGLEAPKLGVIG